MKKKPIDDKKENKRPFFYSQFYDTSDIEAASKNAYNTEMSSKELNRRRKRDWIHRTAVSYRLSFALSRKGLPPMPQTISHRSHIFRNSI